MSLPETLQQLLALQQIDTQIQRAKRQQAALDTGAEAGVQAEAAQAAARQALAAAHKAAGELKDNELKLSGIEAKRKQYQQKLYQGSVTNARELGNIEREIEALGRQRSDLDGRILELMEEAENLQEKADRAEAEARRAETHHMDTVTAFRARHEALALELSELQPHRAAATGAVADAALLKRYETIRAKAGGVGIARVEGNDCGSCHMTLPSSIVKAVRESSDVQSCENCGRLLTR
ncbi:MAG: C4-type zinc ribbon domain-containing protein [Armatimonadota bacterium]|nr:C4-type zinc ribbon domain-containing protein [Armatimonadota bacterium]